jgi:hypothetical protein
VSIADPLEPDAISSRSSGFAIPQRGSITVDDDGLLAMARVAAVEVELVPIEHVFANTREDDESYKVKDRQWWTQRTPQRDPQEATWSNHTSTFTATEQGTRQSANSRLRPARPRFVGILRGWMRPGKKGRTSYHSPRPPLAAAMGASKADELRRRLQWTLDASQTRLTRSLISAEKSLYNTTQRNQHGYYEF